MDEGKRKHAKFSASGSDRWLNCPGSVALSEISGPSPESRYAKEGTDAHLCLEMVMKNNSSSSIVSMLSKRFPRSMVDHAIKTYELIVEKMPQGSKLLTETEVRLDFVDRGMFGTVDAGIVDLFGVLWVIDYKYGAGRLVNPEENSQAIYYALGIAHKYNFNFEVARLGIIQPRIVHREGIFRTWDIEISQLMKWTKKFKDGVKACKDPFADLKKGRWCFFCPAQSICPLMEDDRYTRAQTDFDDG